MKIDKMTMAKGGLNISTQKGCAGNDEREYEGQSMRQSFPDEAKVEERCICHREFKRVRQILYWA